MLKNNKGFMLAEAVITSTIVLTALVSFYATFTKLYSAYEVRSRYYNIDGVYANRNMINHLINTGEINKIFSNETQGFKTNDHVFLVKNKSCINITDCSYTNSLTNLYDINNIVIIEWTTATIDSVINELRTEVNQTFKDYLDYIKKHYDFKNDAGYNYLVITEYKAENSTKEEYNYSSISLR